MTTRNRGLILAAIIFIFDQIVKWWVTSPTGLDLQYEGQSHPVISIFDFTLVHNYGVSLGLFTAQSSAQSWALVALTGAIAGFVLHWLWKETNRYDGLGLGLVLGGAIGNITDRVRFGHVVDYADLHFGEFRPFLVFNIADAAITIGVLILLARALLVKDGAGKTPVSETDNA
jgi:signal peptidase II